MSVAYSLSTEIFIVCPPKKLRSVPLLRVRIDSIAFAELKPFFFFFPNQSNTSNQKRVRCLRKADTAVKTVTKQMDFERITVKSFGASFVIRNQTKSERRF